MTLGRDSCGDWAEASSHEWLVTNGLGGYACGTVAGANTRRYHAFLMASLHPPVGRTLLVAKIDVSVEYLGQLYHLAANEFAGGAIDPQGFIHIESFAVHDGVPTWRYAIADALLEQRIFMAPLANTSFLCLDLKRASGPLRVELKALVTYRDYHSEGRGARAHYRIFDDARTAQSFLAPIAQHLAYRCVGSVSEIFDGDAPHIARGCFAQAWSVAEILRSWIYLERKISKP
ncbi:MAG: glycogen debranching enzyme N-terminal domain-containing protein [Steroidobacteraceae bacterium]